MEINQPSALNSLGKLDRFDGGEILGVEYSPERSRGDENEGPRRVSNSPELI